MVFCRLYSYHGHSNKLRNKILKYAVTIRIYPGYSFIQYSCTEGLLYLERAVKARAENQSQICQRGLACFLSGPPSGKHQKSEAVSEFSKLTLSAIGRCRLEVYTAEVCGDRLGTLDILTFATVMNLQSSLLSLVTAFKCSCTSL